MSYNRIKLINFIDAFKDLNINFDFFYDMNDFLNTISQKKVDIVYTSFHPHFLNKIDIPKIKTIDRSIKILIDLPNWENPLNKSNYTDVSSLKNNKIFSNYLNKNLFDYFTCYLRNDDPRMINFKKDTGSSFFYFKHGINTKRIFNEPDCNYISESSFLGSNLPRKRKTFKKIMPYLNTRNFKIYGQGWTVKSKLINLLQKIGEYKNIKLLTNLKQKKIDLEDERKIYSSSKININIHNDYEHFFGGPINERFFSIAGCKAFQISDHLSEFDSTFVEGKDIVTWKTSDEFIDKYNYYLKNYDLAMSIANNQFLKIINERNYKKIIYELLYHCGLNEN